MKTNRKRQRRHIVRWLVLFGLTGWLLSACSGSPKIPGPGETLNPGPQKGQTDFETTEQGGGSLNSFGERSDGTANAGSAPPSSPSGATKQGAPSGRTGTVEEADLYRVQGNLLFYLNTYKGLTLFDLKDPKNPKKLYNLPVYGYPIEMFIDGKIAYALVRDALYLLRVNGKFQFTRRYVSQMVTIDISNPNKPKVLQRFDIKGKLREGVSRKIDNTIYVVSYTPRSYYWGWSYQRRTQPTEQATVYSFNVANPKAVREVQHIDLIKVKLGTNSGSSSGSGGGVVAPGGGVPAPSPDEPSTRISGSRRFNGVTISATANTLLVGERWYVSKSTNNGSRCGSYESYQELVMQVVDISDTTGKINVHTKFTVRGDLTDQFKQTYIYDEKTKKGTYFGIFRRTEWNSSNCRGERVVKNTLISVDISDGKNPKVLDELAFGKPGETVRGSLFDRKRGVVYAITARQMDPLYAIDIKDPSKLKVLSAVDGLSGDINLFRFIKDRKFLLAIGRDNSGSCSGFGTDRVGTKLAVSIIDVQDVSKVRLVQRKCISVEGAKWSRSAVNFNLDQAHKMIGMYSDSDGTNLLTVPVSYYVRNKDNRFRWWWYEYKSAIGIIKWDLSKYDPKKSHKEQNVLENVATMIHPKGAVKRTIIFKMDQDGKKKRLVANLSDTHMSLIDLDNLKSPTLLSTYEIAPYIRSIYRFGNYAVEQVNLGRNYDQYNEFRVKKLGTGDINDTKTVTNFFVGQIRQVMKVGKLLLLFRYKMLTRNEGGKEYISYDVQKSELLVIDMTNPAKPQVRGNLEVTFPFIPYYRFVCGLSPAMEFSRYGYYGYYSGNNDRWVVTETGIASLIYYYDRTARKSKMQMVFIDLSNPDKPTFTQQEMPTRQQYNKLVKLDDKTFYLTLRKPSRTVKVENYTFTIYKYYAQPWYRQGKSWKAGSLINIPGNLLRAFRDGQKVKFLTRDTGYIRHKVANQNYYRYQNIFRFYLLVQDGNRARLQDFKSFTSWNLRGMLLDGSRLYMMGGRDWYYASTHKNEKDLQSDHLFIYDLSGSTFKQLVVAKTLTYNIQLMGIYKQRLFLNLSGDGVLVVDVRNASKPKGLHFERTLGWLTHVEFSGDKALLAAGHFGVYELDLNQTTIPAL